jgi:hypothetical protein
VDADNVAQGDAEHIVGIGVGEIFFSGKGDFGEILKGFEKVGVEADILESLLVKGHPAADFVQGGLQPLELDLSNFFHCQTQMLGWAGRHAVLLGGSAQCTVRSAQVG